MSYIEIYNHFFCILEKFVFTICKRIIIENDLHKNEGFEKTMSNNIKERFFKWQDILMN